MDNILPWDILNKLCEQHLLMSITMSDELNLFLDILNNLN
jgi:hypothetical protein